MIILACESLDFSRVTEPCQVVVQLSFSNDRLLRYVNELTLFHY